MSDYFDRVERQIVRRVEAGVPRASRLRVTAGHLAVAAAVLVVIVVAGVFLAAGGSGGGAPSPAAHPAVTVTFTASPADPQAIDQSVRLLGKRLNAVLPGAVVSRSGDSVTVTLARGTPGARRRILALSAPGVLAFGDWEANALLPSGRTVASRLPAQDPAAVTISQGTTGSPPGAIGAGCMTVQQALALTAKLGANEPRRTEYLGGLKLRVPTGFVILEATDASAGDLGVYVLRDRPAMLGNAIVNPKPSTDPNTRTATVEFGFTAAGRREFQALTKAISHRGTEVSGLGETLNQHFAIVLDNKLLTVPFIDYKLYPDGVNGDNGADVGGNLTTQSAQDLAILLRYGPLPVQLTTTG